MLEAKDILAAALKLDTGERAHLINELPASLEGIDLGTEWEREIQHRIDDIDTGRVTPVSGALFPCRCDINDQTHDSFSGPRTKGATV